MDAARIARLDDRGVVALAGEDAAKLLQGIVTNDVDLLARKPAIHAGLLSPQGKILFEFFVVRSPSGLLIDVARDKAAELVKRLTMYRLRAKAEITDLSSSRAVTVIWSAAGDGEPTAPPTGPNTIAYPDPRLTSLGLRLIHGADDAPEVNASAHDYHEHRIGLGVPEGGRDWAFGDAFAHDAMFDQLAGVSFTKGCYVGQEIVARMQHRGTARRRIVKVSAAGALPVPGSEIVAGDVAIGTLGSTAGHIGLAMVRIDRVADANARGQPLFAGPVPIRIEVPDWATFQMTTHAGAD